MLTTNAERQFLVHDIHFLPGDSLFKVGAESEWHKCGDRSVYWMIGRCKKSEYIVKMYRLGFFSLPQKLPTENIWRDGSGFVYLIRYGETNAYKIGRSIDPASRLRQLKKDAQCEDISLSFYIRSPRYKRTEALLHGSLSSQRLGGEWFDLSPYQNHLQTIVSGS